MKTVCFGLYVVKFLKQSALAVSGKFGQIEWKQYSFRKSRKTKEKWYVLAFLELVKVSCLNPVQSLEIFFRLNRNSFLLRTSLIVKRCSVYLVEAALYKCVIIIKHNVAKNCDFANSKSALYQQFRKVEL